MWETVKVPVELCFEDRGVRCVYRGEVGLPDVLTALRDVEGHHEFGRISYVLHDCTEIGRFVHGEGPQLDMTASELDSGFGATRARSAVIAQDDVALHSIEQCYERAHQNIEVFNSLYEAQIWADACTGFADLYP